MTTIATEHLGLAAVHKGCAEMNAIWRPTPANDLGVDGQIELLEPDRPVSTGLVLAAQVKSGRSYFAEIRDGEAALYPSKRQREYWARLPLPVILILHNPDEATTVFADVKPQLGAGQAIRVPLASCFSGVAREQLIAIASRYHGAINPEQIVERLRTARLEVPKGEAIAAVEFLLGCTNLERGYFELRMARLHPLFELAQGSTGVSLGQREYDWILRCMMLCWATRLVDHFEDEFEYWWYEREMVPDIAVPLTGLGRQTVEFVLANASRVVAYEALGAESADHAAERAQALMALCQEFSDLHDRSDRLAEHPK
jgi:hypothetical protein